jgi:3-phosphoshikimate 1-carboxyvinyltransferase
VVRVRGDVSSQFLTGLLMALPLRGCRNDGRSGRRTDLRPYVEHHAGQHGALWRQVLRDGWQRFTVPAGSAYRSPGVVQVEGDASSASYFLALGAIGGGPLRVEGVGRDSIQGDVRFADALAGMGAQITFGANWIEASCGAVDGRLQGVDLDCNHIPTRR